MVALVASVLAMPAAAQHATVVDGDTLKLNGTTWRLHGIDAPETKQWCGDYAAGVFATAMLDKLVSGKEVTCEAKATDRYGRTVGICRVDGQDLGKAMVRLGLSWAFVRYSADYVAEEAQARADNLGVHARNCEVPWLWRAQKRQ